MTHPLSKYPSDLKSTKKNLKPLPPLDKYQKFLEEPRKVHKDGLLSYDGVRYGVPWQYSGKEENVIFLGPPGVGKTHLAVALAVEALLQGIPVYFITLSKLIEDFKKCYEENGLDRRMRNYIRPRLLVVKVKFSAE